MIWVGALLDFLDGMSARILKVQSEIGKELDSLADMITFSLLPSVILFQMLEVSSSGVYLPYVSFTVVAFSAIRLARFNIDIRQSNSFIGLPTPANAILVSSLPYIALGEGLVSDWIKSPQLLVFLSIFLSFMLVSNVRLMAFKFKSRSWSSNREEIIFLALSLGLVVVFKVPSIPLILILYLILSFLKRNVTTP